MGRVDIALYVGDSDKPKIIVEIKRIHEKELGTGRQVLQYLRASGIKYGIYTNGKEIRFIDNRTPVKFIPEGLFIIKVKDFVKYKKVLSALTKESVQAGKLDKLVKCFHSKEFWQFIKQKEEGKKKSEKADTKYRLRLEYAEGKL